MRAALALVACLSAPGAAAQPPKSGEHMARAAGGGWKDPDAKMLARIRSEEMKRRESLEHK